MCRPTNSSKNPHPLPPHLPPPPSVVFSWQANTLGADAYPLLEQLAYHISTRNLELVRRLKSNLVALTRRVQKVRDEIEQLMDDDGDMAEMYLTDKRRRVEGASHRQEGVYAGGGGGVSPVGGRGALSAPASPCGSPHKVGLGCRV